MIDIANLRQHPEIYRKAASDKSKDVNFDLILKLDGEVSTKERAIQELRTKRNELAQLGKTDPDKARSEGKRIKDELKALETELFFC
jgi:seryl-tRNA synthetase